MTQPIEDPFDVLAWFLGLFSQAEWRTVALLILAPLLTALVVFVLVQVVKLTFKTRDNLPTLGPAALRLLALASAFPLAYMLSPLPGWRVVLPVALVAWFLAHLTAEYGMAALKEFTPRWYRVLNAEPENRREDVGPKRGKYDRRREV